MSGTKQGGIATRDANLARDPDFYKKIGAIGGSVRNPNKGFGSNRKLARIAGTRGGRSKRNPS